MADDRSQRRRPQARRTPDKDEYTREERERFGIWVELGARKRNEQSVLAGSFSGRWERRDPSGSPWVKRLLMNPRSVLLREKVPGVHKESRITTTILHHHRGLEKKIIVTTATVEDQTGDVSLVIDKETAESS